MSRRLIFALMLTILLAIAFIVPQRPAYADSLTAGTEDELKAAIVTANGTPEPDTILLTNDIVLTSPAETSAVEGDSGLVSITSDITIEGQGFVIARADGAPEFRIIRVGPGGVLTLENLSILNGSANIVYNVGGGILNSGTLTIIHCTIANNLAGPAGLGGMGGGIFNDNIGTLTISDSYIQNNVSGGIGGGIFSYTLTTPAVITDTIISGNRADYTGGGIQNDSGGKMFIYNSTVSYNTAKQYGGGIVNWVSELTIRNTTIADNSLDAPDGQGAGIYQGEQALLTMSNSTIDDNTAGMQTGQGGGVFNHFQSTFTSVNNTLYDNYAAEGGNLYNDNSFNTFTNSIANLTNTILAHSIGGNCAGFGTITGSFSQADDTTCPGVTKSSTIRLDSIADNGGSVYTTALGAGSSALDAAHNADCTGSPVNDFDQRGAKRGVNGAGALNSPQAGDCDIGAYESGGIIRTLQFAAASSAYAYPIPQTLSATLTLGSSLPAGYAPVTVYVCVSGGTAVAGEDYVPFGVKIVTFNPGDTTASVTLDLLSQPTTSDKTIILAIADFNGPGFSGPARLGTYKTTTITLKASPAGAAPALNFSTNTPMLTWSAISGAIGYEIQVDTDTVFVAPYAFHDDTIPADRLYATPSLANGTYYWRVRAKDSAGKPGTWSAIQSFVIGG